MNQLQTPPIQLYTTIPSPLGEILLARNDRGLTYLNFQEGTHPLPINPAWQKDNDVFRETVAQLAAYFAGDLREFDLPLAPQGTPFQLAVWQALQTIPYGRTLTYSQLAQQIDNPTAVRAVGAANGRNPIPVIIPCHRVIGADGSLTGYGGGLPIKEALLLLEQHGTLQPPKQLSIF
ncbi:MAG TPA: methylated-DNA--[protein]-cysteine S-methyltransferase [Chloroflexi bacterium]|nr:methylated-DNA--[protein]-cysteine S-methyltransferase [Chloroflexota bacterium]